MPGLAEDTDSGTVPSSQHQAHVLWPAILLHLPVLSPSLMPVHW